MSRARQADKYKLYQRAVQDTESDVKLLRRFYHERFGSDPRLLREDFCGTGLLACSWVAAHRENRAYGVDLDPEPLAWGRANNVATLSADQSRRVALRRGNVLRYRGERVDVVAAFNFSFFLWKTRPELRRYFVAARSRLHREGLLVLDCYGGSEAMERREERRACGAFTYIWDQDLFDPVTHDTKCFIHFEFRDGSRIPRAFRYDWRLWTIPELRELLFEAGFSDFTAYWEGTDLESGEPNGIFRRVKRAPDDPAWIAYLVAQR